MQIAKWGNSLAVRLPSALVQQLGLKSGDRVSLVPGGGSTGETALTVAREATREERLEALAGLRWSLPAGYRFDREDANARGEALDREA